MQYHPPNVGLRFEEIAASSPSALALLCEGSSFDFEALNSLSNRFARWLIAHGVGRGQVVCLELPKIVEAYALALASIKIGAPYAFLDSEAPIERAQKMLSRCRPALVVSIRAGEHSRYVIADDTQRKDLHRELVDLDDTNLPQTEQITGSDPAYVMFTSGSTGDPKGAVIPHQGILNLVEWASLVFGLHSEDRLTNVNPLHFDNSVFDVYCGLLNGAAVAALDPPGRGGPLQLVNQIAEHQCTFFFAVPTLFMYLDSLHLLRPSRLPDIKHFMFGGEGFPVARLRRIYDAFKGHARLVNCYGPTETSCISSSFDITDDIFASGEGLPPLGRLNPNFSYRILDEELTPVPVGQTGELWLGGPSVGLGYLNDPEETNRRFCQDPLVEGYRSTLFRTGDLVQEDPLTGVLRFRGRVDNQIKLHGYRIELEEIDHALVSIPGVSRAITVVVRDGNGLDRIIAAYTGRLIKESNLLASCRTKLPTYMIPSRFVRLEKMFINPNGKADRRAVAALLTRGVNEKRG